MMKSLVLALCILGVAQPSVIPPTETQFSPNEYFETTEMIHDFFEAVKFFDPEGTFNELSDLPKELEDLFLQLLSGSGQLHKVKREISEKDIELGIKGIEAIDKLMGEMDNSNSSQSKIERLHEIVTKLETGTEKLKNAIDSSDVKNLWRFLCDSIRGKNLTTEKPTVDENGVVVKKKKSLGHKMCSEKTYAKMQNVMNKGIAFFKKIKEIFSVENMDAVKSAFEKVQELWKHFSEQM